MKHAYVTRERSCPIGYVTVTKPLARILHTAGMSVTICGDNVDSFHVFDGWHLGYTIPLSEDFDVCCRDFLSYLESEVGNYLVFYTKKENV